jgi:hypothetical protein
VETTDLPKFELPPPEKLPRWDLPCQGALNPTDLHLVRLYGRPYAVWADSQRARLSVFLLEKEQVGLGLPLAILVPHRCLPLILSASCVIVLP